MMYKKLSWIEKVILEMIGGVAGAQIGYECAMKQKHAAEEQGRLRTLICWKKRNEG